MTKPKFTYGDRIRRKAGGPVETAHDLNDTAYYFEGAAPFPPQEYSNGHPAGQPGADGLLF